MVCSAGVEGLDVEIAFNPAFPDVWAIVSDLRKVINICGVLLVVLMFRHYCTRELKCG